MTTILLGLAVAFLWGSADTIATFSTRRIGSAATTFVAQLSGLFLMAFLGLAFVGPFGLRQVSSSSLVLSILIGVAIGGVSAGAFLSLYKSLNHGPLAVVSPVVSAQGGVTLLLAVLLLQEQLAGFQLLFLLMTFSGVLLASINFRDIARMQRRALLSPGVLWALASMTCFGLLAFGLGLAARSTNWLVSLFFIRAFSFLFVATLQRWDGPQAGEPGRRWWWGYVLAVVVGCADIGGQALLSVATVTGSIGVAGMIASVYGVIPLAAGVLLLKERLIASQFLGVLLIGAGLAGVGAPMPGMVLPLVALCAFLAVGCGLAVFKEFAPRRPKRAAQWPGWFNQPVLVLASAGAGPYLAAAGVPGPYALPAMVEAAPVPTHATAAPQGVSTWQVLTVGRCAEQGALFAAIAQLGRPVVLVVAEPTQAFARPVDFVTLKHIKRREGISIVFVGDQPHLSKLAQRQGFPVYPSMEALPHVPARVCPGDRPV
jgi:drug/metabolite transporter (DMT)-like permease